MSLLSRKKSACVDHEWTSTTNSGLKRSICVHCGVITFEPVDHDITVPDSLQRVVASS